MKIIIGKFDEDGEPIWFEVETNEWKDENGNWKKENEDTPPRVVKGCGEDVFLRFQKFHTTANTGIRQMNKTSAYLKQTMLFWQTRVKMKIDPVCEKNYPLPLNVPNVPYIP